jgi:hypothetical protein
MNFLLLSLGCILAASYRVHPKGGAPCLTDMDCTLGGGCEAGRCVCDAAFTGANCTYFDMLPTPGAAYNLSGSSSWGGRANFDPSDSLWHLHVSEMGYGCGLDTWEPSSTIVEAVAPTVWGPYTRRALVAPAFSHNAESWRLPDGSWLLAQVGSGLLDPKYNGTVADCRATGNGTTPRQPPRVPPVPLPGWLPWGVHRSMQAPWGPSSPLTSLAPSSMASSRGASASSRRPLAPGCRQGAGAAWGACTLPGMCWATGAPCPPGCCLPLSSPTLQQTRTQTSLSLPGATTTWWCTTGAGPASRAPTTPGGATATHRQGAAARTGTARMGRTGCGLPLCCTTPQWSSLMAQ